MLGAHHHRPQCISSRLPERRRSDNAGRLFAVRTLRRRGDGLCSLFVNTNRPACKTARLEGRVVGSDITIADVAQRTHRSS